MLTDDQIRDLAKRMAVPLEFVGFKNQLPQKLKTNRAYIINLDDNFDEETNTYSEGTHWTCLLVMEYPNKKIEPFYFDSYGAAPPEVVKERVKKEFKTSLPFSTKDIQSLMASACGWYCLAFLHFVFVFDQRTRDLYHDVELFLSLFDDLNTSAEWKKNEYILKMFFQPSDPAKRKPIEVVSDTDRITDGDEDAITMQPPALGAVKAGKSAIDVQVKYR